MPPRHNANVPMLALYRGSTVVAKKTRRNQKYIQEHNYATVTGV